MTKNGKHSEETLLEHRFAEFKRLPKKELLAKLDGSALSRKERGLIRSILQDGPIVWTSKDMSTTIKRGLGDVSFKVMHTCIGGVVESDYENYDDAIYVAAWICNKEE